MNLLPDSIHLASLTGLAVALGIGLLIGAERERRKREGPRRQAAGLRTFALSALLGALGWLLGGLILFSLVLGLVGIGTWIAYWTSQQADKAADHDPGITTEIALILTCLLGGLAMRLPAVAAGLAALVALLLFARQRLHQVVRQVLTEQEMRDLLLFAAIALIAWPLAPDRYLGPYDALNPQALVRLIVLVMGINALGYVAVRALGAQRGLPLAGLASGFISSTATIYAMGQLSQRQPGLLQPAVAGAILSSVATFLQLALVLGSLHPPLLKALLMPLLSAGAAAGMYALVFLLRGKDRGAAAEPREQGRAFDFKAAATFSLIVAGVLMLSAALNAVLGQRGLMLGAAVAGLADAHASAASLASLLASSRISMDDALIPVLLGISSNTLMKAVMSMKAGAPGYATRIVPGLAFVLAALWAGFALA